jgi:hypothetical protein
LAFIVLYDACVLYPPTLRDLLIRIGQAGLVRAKWTDRILDECFRSILRDRPDLSTERLARTRQLMNQALLDVLVTGYEDLIPGIQLPDSDDRHVVAAAIRAGAQVIVTSNVKDFPNSVLAPLGLEAMSADQFVLDIVDLEPDTVIDVLEAQAAELAKPRKTVPELLDRLEGNALPRAAGKLRELYLAVAARAP